MTTANRSPRWTRPGALRGPHGSRMEHEGRHHSDQGDVFLVYLPTEEEPVGTYVWLDGARMGLYYHAHDPRVAKIDRPFRILAWLTDLDAEMDRGTVRGSA